MKIDVRIAAGCAVLLSGLLVGAAQAGDGGSNGKARNRGSYEVEITNVTKGQSFTPIIVITDRSSVQFFELGEAASDDLATLAEGGDTAPLGQTFSDLGASVLADDGGLLGPGESRVLLVETKPGARFLSLGGMLLPTNDTFVALNDVRLPRYGSATHTAAAYDAGTEENDQDCANIPGPLCQGVPDSEPADTDEGYVYISNGFHELGEDLLAPATYDWRNPVAVIKIQRTH